MNTIDIQLLHLSEMLALTAPVRITTLCFACMVLICVSTRRSIRQIREIRDIP